MDTKDKLGTVLGLLRNISSASRLTNKHIADLALEDAMSRQKSIQADTKEIAELILEIQKEL